MRSRQPVMSQMILSYGYSALKQYWGNFQFDKQEIICNSVSLGENGLLFKKLINSEYIKALLTTGSRHYP